MHSPDRPAAGSSVPRNGAEARAVRVLLADDHKIVREGVRRLLEATGDIAVVAEADDGRQAVALAAEARPDVVVTDVAMPGLNGIDATAEIRAADPAAKVVIVSVHTDPKIVSRCLSAGAAPYVPKAGSVEELSRAIRTVARGQIYLSPRVADAVLARPIGASQVLSAREREMLRLIAEGLSLKECAARLHLSVKTIEAHRRSIMSKTGLDSVAGLTRYAIREGLATI
jgi:two-component system response regulator NreC